MGGRARRRIARESQEFAREQVAAYRAEQAIQRDILEKQKEEYRQFEFVNPYRDLQNYYEDMENVFEDLTVDTQAADFQMERGEQQRANILQALRGAAGGSGIANLAQSLANQGILQAAQVSANIAQQERQNQMLAARAANQIQTAERRGMAAADMAQRGGEAMVQQAEMSRINTLLGIEFGGMAGANAGLQAAYANQMGAFGLEAQMLGAQMGMYGNIIGGIAQGAGTAGSAAILAGSDRRLKKNINLIGKSPSGINIYSFEYKNSMFGTGTYQGVMADEVPHAVVSNNGYDMVDYSLVDVDFKQI
tara:strand:- start:944 stop:1864 length:921 start_codon:yes stop_codon:yes gene_type:complete